MRETFAFRVSPEATSDENMRRPLLNVLLATAPRTSFGYSPQTKPRLTGQGIVRLLVSGFSDSVMLNVVETFDKAFDVSPSSAASQFFLGSATLASQGTHHRLERRGAGIPDGAPKSVWLAEATTCCLRPSGLGQAATTGICRRLETHVDQGTERIN
jgi:hypothetical protein